MPMLAFFCGLALLMHGVGAGEIPCLFMQPSMHGGWVLRVVGDVLSRRGWHMPKQVAARRSMSVLTLGGGLALLMLGVGAGAFPGLFMQPSMHCGMALRGVGGACRGLAGTRQSRERQNAQC